MTDDERLVLLTERQLAQIHPWFMDAETQRWLGDGDWLGALWNTYVTFQTGAEFRGARVLAHAWYLLDDQTGRPVALVGGELYDRRTQFVGEGPDGPRFVDVPGPHTPEASLLMVVDPLHRHQGWGTRAVQAAMTAPAFAPAMSFVAGVEPENIGSRRVLERLGFTLESPEPDWEGMLNYQKPAPF